MRRRALVSSPAMLAEVLELHRLSRDYTHESYAPKLQVVFPVEGVHYIGTDAHEVLLDLNQVAIVPSGITTKDRHPACGDTTCLIVTPSPEMLAEVWCGTDTRVEAFVNTPCRTRPNDPRDQVLAGMLTARSQADCTDRSAFEEVLVALLRRTAGGWSASAIQVTGRSQALARQVRELLASTLEPLTLSQIAEAVGASPTYLTDVFRKVEGMPIYRYQTRLRLARALAELPAAEDITALALDLGFSSHSHFSNVFRTAFGISPSSYRDSARPRIVRIVPANDSERRFSRAPF